MLHEASTLEIDRRVHTNSALVTDTDLLLWISKRDMVALEAQYNNMNNTKVYSKHCTQNKEHC